MLNNKNRLIYFFLSLILLFLGACQSYNDVKPSVVGNIQDTDSWYSDMNNDILRMDVTIPTPNSSLCADYNDITGPLRACTFEDVNNDVDAEDSYNPELNVIFSTSYFSSLPDNAIFESRGFYSRTQSQKSYGVKLNSKINLLNKQRKFNINKHQSDASRMKNKLAFNLFRMIPNITSLKTQFVNLWINNIDYGLFTHVEAPREEWLINRGFNKDDTLYNVANFLFNYHDELAVDAVGQPINTIAFNTVLEIKNGNNHLKVNEMVEAVETTTDINQVIAKYFNRDNYITWMAINLILGNQDISYHNFYLYNPKNSDTFYFLPWDYDGAWATVQYLGKIDYGISVYWESPLHRKFLSIKQNRDDVYAMVETLKQNYMNAEVMNPMIASYEAAIKPFILQLPDSENLSENAWKTEIDYLVPGIDYNIALFKSVIGDPMPFHEYVTYQLEDNSMQVTWDESIDFEGDTIVYDIYVSDDPSFPEATSNKYKSFPKIGVTGTSYSTNSDLIPGIYYLKVIARDDLNASSYQIAFDTFYGASGTRHGVLEFEVK